MSDPTPLDQLRTAIETFAATIESGILVNAAVVIWEEVAIADDPDEATVDGMVHRTSYAIPAGSSSNAIGLARIGEQLMIRDLTNEDDDQ